MLMDILIVMVVIIIIIRDNLAGPAAAAVAELRDDPHRLLQPVKNIVTE